MPVFSLMISSNVVGFCAMLIPGCTPSAWNIAFASGSWMNPSGNSAHEGPLALST
jgi:hypothetical protein